MGTRDPALAGQRPRWSESLCPGIQLFAGAPLVCQPAGPHPVPDGHALRLWLGAKCSGGGVSFADGVSARAERLGGGVKGSALLLWCACGGGRHTGPGLGRA